MSTDKSRDNPVKSEYVLSDEVNNTKEVLPASVFSAQTSSSQIPSVIKSSAEGLPGPVFVTESRIHSKHQEDIEGLPGPHSKLTRSPRKMQKGDLALHSKLTRSPMKMQKGDLALHSILTMWNTRSPRKMQKGYLVQRTFNLNKRFEEYEVKVVPTLKFRPYRIGKNQPFMLNVSSLYFPLF